MLIRPPRSAYSIRAFWVKPRLPPSTTTLARNSEADDAAGVVGVVANLRVGLVAGPNVGPDAAVVQQVNFRAQDRANQTVAVQLVGVDLERGAHLRA